MPKFIKIISSGSEKKILAIRGREEIVVGSRDIN